MLKIGILAVTVLLACWISFVSIQRLRQIETIRTAVTSQGFSGLSSDYGVPRQEIEAVFESVKGRMVGLAQNSKSYTTASVIVSWLSFVLGAVVTLIAGYLGQINVSQTARPENLLASLKDGVKLTRALGTIAAAATICTGASVKLSQSAEENRARAIQLRDVLVSAQKDLAQAGSQQDIRAIVERLRLEATL